MAHHGTNEAHLCNKQVARIYFCDKDEIVCSDESASTSSTQRIDPEPAPSRCGNSQLLLELAKFIIRGVPTHNLIMDAPELPPLALGLTT
mmetsp:Transcript_24374/g.78734  ORF Transcript_24374/g.78734 Transcript_24374/m.78734 type:complete len:90 (-) Transcript_24374:1818-2087(-)